MSAHWKEKSRPARLEGRFEFDDYDQTRDFLEAAAAVSKEIGYYPDISFGRTYVNMTLHAPEDAGGSPEAHTRFARRIDALLAGGSA